MSTTGTIIDDAAAGRAKLEGLTVKQYHALIESGLLPTNLRTELIDGFIVRKDRSHVGEDPMTIGDRHVLVVNRIVRLAEKFDHHNCFLQSQQPVVIPPNHEPEPDASVIAGTLEDYTAKPRAKNVLSVIEVCDNSLSYDLSRKLQIYAAARIPQYVVVDLIHDVVIVHEKPKGKAYGSTKELRGNEMLRISAGSGTSVAVSVEALLG
ncbi:MAG TPA: Uma2 family endonuclease [Tepidisphaeraceae bacterium]|jgi:Uma2 family endonuclease|nr:Uma2 family endonuclease [Tepidisphaeraceae bacterium]